MQFSRHQKQCFLNSEYLMSRTKKVACLLQEILSKFVKFQCGKFGSVVSCNKVTLYLYNAFISLLPVSTSDIFLTGFSSYAARATVSQLIKKKMNKQSR